MDRISKRAIERMSHCELIEALDCAAELGRFKRARRLGREYMRRCLGPSFVQSGPPAKNLNHAMQMAQERAAKHDPHWRVRDLWKDLKRADNAPEWVRYVLVRCLYWGVNIDKLTVPKGDGETCDECGEDKGPFYAWGPKGKDSICQSCLEVYNAR